VPLKGREKFAFSSKVCAQDHSGALIGRDQTLPDHLAERYDAIVAQFFVPGPADIIDSRLDDDQAPSWPQFARQQCKESLPILCALTTERCKYFALAVDQSETAGDVCQNMAQPVGRVRATTMTACIQPLEMSESRFPWTIIPSLNLQRADEKAGASRTGEWAVARKSPEIRLSKDARSTNWVAFLHEERGVPNNLLLDRAATNQRTSCAALRMLRTFATHRRVYVMDEVPAVGKLCRHCCPFSLKDRACQCIPDFAFPKLPKASRDVSTLVKLIDIGDELHRVQRAVRKFLARRWHGLRGTAVRKPGLGGEQAEQFLEPPRELNEHLQVQLPALIAKSHENSDASNCNGSNVSEVCQYVGNHVQHLLRRGRSQSTYVVDTGPVIFGALPLWS
jgi:hypothetical protein